LRNKTVIHCRTANVVSWHIFLVLTEQKLQYYCYIISRGDTPIACLHRNQFRAIHLHNRNLNPKLVSVSLNRLRPKPIHA